MRQIALSAALFAFTALFSPAFAEDNFAYAEDHAVSTVTASFTFDATMQAVLVGSRSTALTAAVTGTLPACAAATKGRTYSLKKRDSSTNNVTLAAAGTDTIDGAATVILTAQNTVVSARCDGAGSWERGVTP